MKKWQVANDDLLIIYLMAADDAWDTEGQPSVIGSARLIEMLDGC